MSRLKGAQFLNAELTRDSAAQHMCFLSECECVFLLSPRGKTHCWTHTCPELHAVKACLTQTLTFAVLCKSSWVQLSELNKMELWGDAKEYVYPENNTICKLPQKRYRYVIIGFTRQFTNSVKVLQWLHSTNVVWRSPLLLSLCIPSMSLCVQCILII